MITQQTQIKLNLPVALKEHLESRARKFGMSLAAYVRHLILKEVEEMEYPTFEASKATIKAYKQALKDRGKAIRVEGDVHEFFRNL